MTATEVVAGRVQAGVDQTKFSFLNCGENDDYGRGRAENHMKNP